MPRTADRWIAMLVTLIVCLTGARDGRAATRATTLVVLADGAPSTAAATALEHALAPDFAVGDPEPVRAKLRADWGKALLLGVLASGRRDKLLADARNAARDSGVRGVIVLGVSSTRKARTAHVAFIDLEATESPVECEAALGPHADAATIASAVRAALEPSLRVVSDADAPSAGPVPAATAVVESKHEAPKDAVAPEPRRPLPHDYAHGAVVAAPYVGIGTRHFGYTQGLSPGLRSYNISAAPIVGVAAEVYPYAFIDSDVLSAFGIVGEYAHSVGIRSSLPDGSRVDSSWTNADVALRGRLVVSQHALLGARAGYGSLAFSYGDAGALNAQLPSVKYEYLRLGVDARVEVWRFAFYANADYLSVQGAGDVADRFPRPSVDGIDVGGGVAFGVGQHFEVRTGGRYQRFFYDFRSQPNDPIRAGGAVDELGRWDTRIAFFY